MFSAGYFRKSSMVLILVAMAITQAVAFGDENLTVLPDQWQGGPSAEITHRYLQKLAIADLDARAEKYEKLKTPDQIAAYQKSMRSFFTRQLGVWPQRTPLNAQIVGRRDFDNYRMEKVIFESRPNFHVTATLRLPKTDPPYPAVLVPCGHHSLAKAYEPYQRVSILLAMNGIASFCFDPIGQGERVQILDDQNKPVMGSTHEHTVVGQGAILLGINTASFFVWDAMRAVDYLASRDDIDADRIGCTGNSGGGTQTTYMMALDDRIKAAAPCCFLTSIRRLIETINPQDAEQNIHNAIGFGMEHADYIIMRAPKPTLMCTATRDFFDIQGSWDTFREAKRIYTRLGFAERVDLVEADEQHGFNKPQREAAVRWMRRWLLRIDEPITEPDFPISEPNDVLCTPVGQVILMDGEKTVFDFNSELERELAQHRQRFWKETVRQDAQAKVRELAGMRAISDLPELKYTKVGSIDRQGYRIDKVILETEPGIALPTLVFEPPTRTGDVYLYLNGQGKAVDAAVGGPIEQLVREGHTVFALDLRSTGETQKKSVHKSWYEQFGEDWPDMFLAYLLGKSFVGMRAEDIQTCGRFLASYNSNGQFNRVHLIAIGEATIPATHAAGIAPTLFATVKLERFIGSWREVVTSKTARRQLAHVVHDALRYYDLPDLRSLIPSERLILVDPVDAAGELITAENIR